MRILDFGETDFRNGNKMLKVSIGDRDTTLRCHWERDVSSGDPDFVEARVGDFVYVIPERFLSESQKLMLTLWQVDVKQLGFQIGLMTEVFGLEIDEDTGYMSGTISQASADVPQQIQNRNTIMIRLTIAGLIVMILALIVAIISLVIRWLERMEAPTHEIVESRKSVLPSDDGRVQWQRSSGWYPYGNMEPPVQSGDQHIFELNGSSEGGLGVSRESAINPDQTRNVLLVRVLELGESEFKCFGRMLKVAIGAGDTALRCASEGGVSPGDADFVEIRAGDFFYVIPERFFSDPQKLVLAFWQAKVKDLRLMIGLATEAFMREASWQRELDE